MHRLLHSTLYFTLNFSPQFILHFKPYFSTTLYNIALYFTLNCILHHIFYCISNCILHCSSRCASLLKLYVKFYIIQFDNLSECSKASYKRANVEQHSWEIFERYKVMMLNVGAALNIKRLIQNCFNSFMLCEEMKMQFASKVSRKWILWVKIAFHAHFGFQYLKNHMS